MPATSTTKLEAVNYLLSIVGEAPVSALNTEENSSASVAIATSLIDEVDRMVQSRGWGFNTTSLFTFTKTSGQFPVSSDTLRLNIIAAQPSTNLLQRFVLRDNKIFDSTYGTFTNPVIPGTTTQYTALLGERVFLVDFTELPQSARQYITIRAGRMFLQRVLPDEASNKISEIDEQMAFAMLIEWEIKSGRSTDYSKFSTELESLGINLSVFSNASTEDKTKLVKLSGESLVERQGREYYEARIKGKTTLTSDTYATYKDNFNRIGVSEKDFASADPMVREELLVIAKNTTTAADTRAAKFFTSTNASKASKLGVRYSDFLKLSREEQQVFLDGVSNLSDDRFSRFISVKAKADKIGVKVTDFFAYKPEEQELFLDSLASAGYTDTRAADYIVQQAKLKTLGIYPNDFFALSYDQQSLLLEAVASANYTETRAVDYITNQSKLKKIGVWPGQFFSLPKDQQNLLLQSVSNVNWTDTRYQSFLTNIVEFKLKNITLKDFLGLKPEDQQNLIEGNTSLESLISSTQVQTFENLSPVNEHLNDVLMMSGLNPVTSLAKDYAQKASYIFSQVLKEVQSMGWHYNTDTDVTLTPASGRIQLPSDALSVDVDKTTYYDIDPVIRYDSSLSQSYLWDKMNNTWLNKTIVAEVVRELDIRSVPSLILKYAKVRAAKDLVINLGGMTNSPDLSIKTAYLVQDEIKAKADAVEQDSKQGDYSIFDNYSVSNILDR